MNEAATTTEQTEEVQPVEFSMNVAATVSLAAKEEIINEEMNPCKRELDFVGGVKGIFNIADGELVSEIPIASGEGLSLNYDIKQIFKTSEQNYNCGNGMRLNLHEKFNKKSFSSSDYIYTDPFGDKYDFKEHFYYLNNDNTKTYVKKGDLAVSTDGSHSGVREYHSATGLKATTQLAGLKKIEFLEQRQDEIKQLEEQLEEYTNLLKDYVFVDIVTGDVSDVSPKGVTLESLGMDGYDEFMSQSNSDNMLLTRNESFQYKNLILQRDSVMETSPNTGDIIPREQNLKQQILSLESTYYELNATLRRYAQRYYDVTKAEISDEYKNIWKEIFSLFSSDKIIPMQYIEMLTDEIVYEEYDLGSNPSQLEIAVQAKQNGYVLKSQMRQRNLYLEQLDKLNKDLRNQWIVLQRQINYIKRNSGKYIKKFKSYYKEHVNKRDELALRKKYVPVSYLSNGEIVKGFNEEGNIVAIWDSCGNNLMFERDKSNRISRIVDDKDHAIKFAYRSSMLNSITDANGNKTKFSYTGNNLTTITYPNGKTLTFTYANSQIASIESSDKLKVDMSYASSSLTSLTYRNLAAAIQHGKSPTSLNTQLNTITFEYNANKTLITCNDNMPTKQQYTFNEEGNLTEYILEEDNKVTKAEKYDYKKYEKDYIIYAKKDTLYKDSLSIFKFVPDEFTNITLNDFNNPTREETSWIIIGYDNSVTPAIPVTQKKITTYAYDGEQRIEQETCEVTTKTGTNVTVKTAIKTYAYNSQGSVVRTESYILGEEYTGGKTIEETIYDDKGRVVKSFTYNSLDPSSKFYTENEYAEDGKITAEIDETGENRTKLEYVDGTEIVCTKILPNGSKFSYGHDANDTVTAITQSTEEGEENSTQTSYTCGEVTQVKSGNNVVNYSYDYKRRKTAVKLNGTKEYVKYEYTDIKTNNIKTGEKVTATMANGDIIESERDLRGNVLSIAHNGVVQTTAIYDEKDRVKKLVDGITNQTTQINYDVLDRLTSVTGGRATETYEYNTDGNVSKKTVTIDGENTVYGYAYKTNAAKDLDYINVNDISVYPKSDCLGRNTGKEIKVNGITLASETMAYRKVGDHATNMPSAMRFGNHIATAGGKTQFVQLDNLKYKYDNCGNISEVWENGKLAAKYTYDKLNRLIREDNKQLKKTTLFTYDNNGNILSKREFAFTLKETEKLEELNETQYSQYAYNGDRLMSLNSENFVYDVLGNPTTYRNNTLVWEKGRQLKQYGTTTFEYDGQGRRTSKNTTQYVYDSNGNLLKQTGGTNTLKFLYDNGGVIGITHTKGNETKNYFYRENAQGDIIALLDSRGAVVVKYVYDAWGTCEVHNSDGSVLADQTHIGNLNPFRYRGYYYDVETGLYFLKTRYYDPEVGRFITIDDLQYLDPETINGLNLYAYCANNPVMAVDHEGTMPKWLKKVLKVVAAVVVVAVVAAAVAVTAGAAAVAIAGTLGATAIMAGTIGAAVATTAFICGGVVGSIEIANQAMNKGLANINLLTVGIATMGASLDGAMIAGAAFASPIGKSVLGISRTAVSGLKSWAYGASEGYSKDRIASDVIQGMLFTAAASVIPFFNKSVKPSVLLPQGSVAQFTSLIKLGTAVFSKLNEVFSLRDLIKIKKIYPMGPVGPLKGLL